MKKIILVKGRSYSTREISCDRSDPIEVYDDDFYNKLMKTGRFKELQIVNEDNVTNFGKGEDSVKIFDQMKKDELIAYAEEKGIDISECKNNEERIVTIKIAMEGSSIASNSKDIDGTATLGFEE